MHACKSAAVARRGLVDSSCHVLALQLRHEFRGYNVTLLLRHDLRLCRKVNMLKR